MIELTGVGAGARGAWSQALPRDPNALVSQTPAWMDCVCASGSYEDTTRAYATADDHQLILPLARRRLPGAAGAWASMPFGWGTGGIVTTRGHLRGEEVAAVVAELASQRVLWIGVRPPPATQDAWANGVPQQVVRSRYMTQTVDLAGGFDAVWTRGFASTVRSHCRKAERRGVTVERDDTGRLMPVFDALYRKSVERWAHQQHEPPWLARWRARRRDPPEKRHVVAERLGPACRVWIARRAGEPIAAMIILTHGQHSVMWRAAMDKEAVKGTGANELLHRMSIEEACESGHRYFHLGESAPSSELARYKRGFGAEEAHCTGYRFERLPLTAADRFLRRQVKRVIRFQD